MKHRLTITLALVFGFSFASQAASVDIARQWYSRLTGLPAGPNHPVIVAMAAKLDAGDTAGAADLALQDPSFIDVVVRQLATPMSNRTGDPFYELNDFSATVMGVVRDDVDARELLKGNFTYEGATPLNLPLNTRDSNAHYQKLDTMGLSLAKSLKRVSPQWRDGLGGAGLLTTRGWAEAHYNAGTNRRALAMTLENFLCRPITTMKDTRLPPYRIRQDIDREPAGKPIDFQQTCRGCHAGMDPMAGAFANLDFDSGIFMILKDYSVAKKYVKNSGTYTPGYVTSDNSWENYWALYNSPQNLGWRGALKGNGAQELGASLAETEAFGQCLARRVVAQVCRLKDYTAVPDAVAMAMAHNFEADGYKMRSLYRDAIRTEGCF